MEQVSPCQLLSISRIFLSWLNVFPSVSLRHSGDRRRLQDGFASAETLRAHKLLSHHQSRCFHRRHRSAEQHCLCEYTRTCTHTHTIFRNTHSRLLNLSAAILRPPHPHWRRDHRLWPDPRCHRQGVTAAAVNHHRGGGAGRLQGHGAPGWRQRCSEVNSRWDCCQRHRPVCPVLKVQRRKSRNLFPVFIVWRWPHRMSVCLVLHHSLSLPLSRLPWRPWLRPSSLRFPTRWFLISKWEASSQLKQMLPPSPKPRPHQTTPLWLHPHNRPPFKDQWLYCVLANHNAACSYQPIRMPGATFPFCFFKVF